MNVNDRLLNVSNRSLVIGFRRINYIYRRSGYEAWKYGVRNGVCVKIM